MEICKLQALTFQVDKVEEKTGNIDFFYNALNFYCKQYTSQLKELNIPFVTEEMYQKLWKLTDRGIESRRTFMKTCMYFCYLPFCDVIFSGSPSCSYPRRSLAWKHDV